MPPMTISYDEFLRYVFLKNKKDQYNLTDDEQSELDNIASKINRFIEEGKKSYMESKSKE